VDSRKGVALQLGGWRLSTNQSTETLDCYVVTLGSVQVISCDNNLELQGFGEISVPAKEMLGHRKRLCSRELIILAYY
jgi:hypothetical protein